MRGCGEGACGGQNAAPLPPLTVSIVRSGLPACCQTCETAWAHLESLRQPSTTASSRVRSIWPLPLVMRMVNTTLRLSLHARMHMQISAFDILNVGTFGKVSSARPGHSPRRQKDCSPNF
ncbi:hypothetical protein H310_08124 [Aphanomyces invadans]|uniref:Uncharacterized protein n=1 Tax=Aphanomyces invadans TaxID=157072 RepID=A0A024U1H6_9STRA|nr:hypothetical protein H310_08124 [Aphanomyces invadans]ETV99432.1 hypothetical protein H310_08124 [Aphanomyces invadans]|eukprot:XP_008871988.1 hypothetical protein H310_08124 [Aphanomyces invadans]